MLDALARFLARMLFIFVVLVNILFVVSWWDWDSGYGRAMTVVYVLPLIILVAMALGFTALLLSHQIAIALLYLVGALVAGILFGLGLLLLANSEHTGQAGLLLMLAICDMGVFLVLRQVWRGSGALVGPRASGV
jgi:heme A synthase